jgi:hypothetical protein
MHPKQYEKLKTSSGAVGPGPDVSENGAEAPEMAHTKRKRGPPATHVEPVLTTIRGAREILGLGNTTVWGLIKAGDLRTAKFGRRTMVEIASIHETIARRLSDQAGKAA